MDLQLDNAFLRNASGIETAKYYQHLRQTTDSDHVFTQLLRSVEANSIPPRVVSLFLNGFSSHEQLVQAMQYEYSRTIRSTAIRRFRRRLKSKQFSAAWQAAGGAAGLVQLLRDMSVDDVSMLCRAFGATATLADDDMRRREHMTELVKALASDVFTDSTLKNPDRRPLAAQYAKIVPACTREFVQEWERNDRVPSASSFDLCQAFPEMYQQECLEGLAASEGKFDFLSYEPLLRTLPPRPTNQGISASMQFSFRFLAALESHPKAQFYISSLEGSNAVIVERIALPLLARMRKKRMPKTSIAGVVKTVLHCLEMRPTELPQGIDIKGKFFTAILQLWKSDPDMFDEILARTLQLVQVRDHNLHRIAASLQEHPDVDRLRLLRHELLYLAGLQIRMDEVDDLQKLQQSWPSSIFFDIPSEAALALIDKLKQSKPDEPFIDCSRVGDSILAVDNGRRSVMHEMVLSKGRAGAFERARKAVDEYKRRAATSRDQSERADLAKHALFFAVASNSLDVLEDVILWMRRFNKDPLTIKELYAQSSVETREMVALLAIPSANVDRDHVMTHITQANRIMLSLFETERMALKEPGFRETDWLSTNILFGLVVTKRLDNSPAMETNTKLKNAELYDCVVRPTFEMLLTVEKTVMEERYQSLRLYGPQGTMFCWLHNIPDSSRPMTCRFLDELARERDALWENHRRTLHPAVVTLPDLWPRGLALQELLPTNWSDSPPVDNMDCRMAMPFLLDRAKNIVFNDATSTMANQHTDDETIKAIGTHVDDYKFALGLYVRMHPEEGTAEARANNAWQYATRHLSDPNMMKQEVCALWYDVFDAAGVSALVAEDQGLSRQDPVLPEGSPDMPTEWNPDPDYVAIQRRTFLPTCLDLLLDSRRSYDGQLVSNISRGGLFKNKTIWFSAGRPGSRVTTVQQQTKLWARRDAVNWRNIQPQTREALIAASLLFLNNKYCSKSNILAEAFPSRSDPRFPALFLADEFLEQDGIRVGADLPVKGLRGDVPPLLLHRLCQTLFATIEDDNKNATIILLLVFPLIRTLAKGDSPQSCLDLVEYVIMERPNDSSWHRLLLTPTLLKALPRDIAEQFLSRIVSRVVTLLKEQAEQQRIAATQKDSQFTPLIKITTVKMLAQLMATAGFVDESFKLDALMQLFTCSSHIDVRAAVVEQLIAMMLSTSDEAMREEILSALESYALPVAASLNERRPMSEADWEQASNDASVPEIPQGFQSTPISDAFFEAVRNATLSRRTVLFRRLLLPLIQQSAENNRKWMCLFIRVHRLSILPEDLPNVPVDPGWLMTTISTYTDITPLSILDTWRNATLINLQPPAELEASNNSILSSPDLRESNAAKHWLDLWNRRGSQAYYYHGATITPLLTKAFTTTLEEGITHADAAQAFAFQAKTIILRGNETLVEQNGLLHQLRPPYYNHEETWTLWTQNCRPLIQNLIIWISAIRSPEWQRDPNRKPAVLPDTYILKLWLLMHTNPSHPSLPPLPCHEERLENFTAELLAETEELGRSQEPYQKHFDELKTLALTVRKNDHLLLACRLGRLESIDRSTGPTLGDHLRMKLAQALILNVKKEKEALPCSDEAWGMLWAWRNCEYERVRMRGIQTLRELENASKS